MKTRELSDEELRKIGVIVNPSYTYVLGIFPVKQYKVAKKEEEEDSVDGDGVATTEKEGIWFSGARKKQQTKRKIHLSKQITKRRYIKVAK